MTENELVQDLYNKFREVQMQYSEIDPTREGAARNDAERERRARGDWEARARAAEADAARLAGKLHAAQREIVR
ncbi:unnamed protein product [Colias eurytheme]|nr:unnamed protein product [Colias eurytheme]